MDVKAEPANGVVVPKNESQNAPGPNNQKGKFPNPHGPNNQKKKVFPNRGGKMGNPQQGNQNRGPIKQEVSREIDD